MSKKENQFSEEKLGQFGTFEAVIQKLRGPGGCPWDIKQTHNSLKQYLVEECYEVLETIEEKNSAGLGEELGDLWLQIMLHAQIAEEEGEFKLEDVIRNINRKLIHRHPHVFGNVKINSADEVALKWEELKGREKAGNSSLLSGVPRNLPALAHSQSVQRRAASVGFDWEKVEDIIEKLVEEIQELRKAESYEAKVNEFGDIIFTLANIARRMDIDLESALRQANDRFSKRFNHIEETCKKKNINIQSLSLREMDALWNEAKAAVG